MLDRFCDNEGFTTFLPQKKYAAEIANWIVGKWQVIAIKPQTFMNRSWASVQQLMNYYKIEPDDILVFQDDIDLPQWTIRLKYGWSSWGHKWIRDIAEKIWTEKFRRLKFGVGRPDHPEHDVSDYVLGEMTQSEKDQWRDLAKPISDKVYEYLKNTW